MANMENLSDAQIAALKLRSEQNGVPEATLYDRDSNYPVMNTLWENQGKNDEVSTALTSLSNKLDKQSEVSAFMIAQLRIVLDGVEQMHTVDTLLLKRDIESKVSQDELIFLINNRSKACEENVNAALVNMQRSIDLTHNQAFEALVQQLNFLDQRISKHTTFFTVTITGATETLSKNEAYYLCNPTGAQAVTLPTAFEMDENRVWLKNLTANTITISPANVAETIDGSVSIQLTSQYDYVELGCDGAVWYVTSN